MKYRHLVFDFDGVLATGTNEAYLRCYEKAAARCGILLEPELVRQRVLKNWGYSLRTEVEGLLPEYPGSVEPVMAAYDSMIVAELVGAAEPAPGLNAVANLARRCNLSIISGMREDALRILVEKFGLSKLFCEIISTDATGIVYDKPSGYHLKKLLEQYSLEPRQVLCAGDGRSDILMAKQCGCPIVIVLGGVLSEQEARGHGADGIVRDLHHLDALLSS